MRILGYCLMPNHVHVIAVPERETSLARAFGRAHSEYALAVNRETGERATFGRIGISPVAWTGRTCSRQCVTSS